MKLIILIACRGANLKAALLVSAVVGTALNLINQWGGVADGESISISRTLMNYVVPFLVSSFSAARNELIKEGRRSE